MFFFERNLQTSFVLVPYPLIYIPSDTHKLYTYTTHVHTLAIIAYTIKIHLTQPGVRIAKDKAIVALGAKGDIKLARVNGGLTIISPIVDLQSANVKVFLIMCVCVCVCVLIF